MNNLPPLVPPFRFAQVERGIYRSAYPTLKNYRFLDRLQLQTIVSLAPFPPIEDLVEYAQTRGIELQHIQVKQAEGKEKEAEPPTVDQVRQALQLVTDRAKWPLAVHCIDGSHHTTLVMMCLRRMQNWDISSIQLEAQRFVKTISKSEAKFVKSFKIALELPLDSPGWLAPMHLGNGAQQTLHQAKDPQLEVLEQSRLGIRNSDGAMTHGFEQLVASTKKELGAAAMSQKANVAPGEYPVSNYNTTLEALALEGMTMRGSQHEHTQLVKGSGRTKQRRPRRYTFLYC